MRWSKMPRSPKLQWPDLLPAPAVGLFCSVIAGCGAPHLLLCGKEVRYADKTNR